MDGIVSKSSTVVSVLKVDLVKHPWLQLFQPLLIMQKIYFNICMSIFVTLMTDILMSDLMLSSEQSIPT